jgi:hypothetical protein
MRALALLLVVAVPSAGFSQSRLALEPLALDPSFDQPTSNHLLDPAEDKDSHQPSMLTRWYFWAGTSAVLTLLAAAIGIGFAVGAHQSSPVVLTQSSFACGMTMSCDGWVNMPTR